LSVAEVASKPIFGPITADDMRRNELLIKTVFPLVRDACNFSKGRFTAEYVFDGLIENRLKLWGVLRPPASLEAIVVTQAVGGVFEILALGPEFEDALAFLPMLTGEARMSKCKRMRITGPKFWRKEYLPEFDLVACVFERDLTAA
jgi:hypothetical protein